MKTEYKHKAKQVFSGGFHKKLKTNTKYIHFLLKPNRPLRFKSPNYISTKKKENHLPQLKPPLHITKIILFITYKH